MVCSRQVSMPAEFRSSFECDGYFNQTQIEAHHISLEQNLTIRSHDGGKEGHFCNCGDTSIHFTTRRRLAGHYYSLKSDFLREVLLTGLKKLFQLCYDVFFHPALFSQRAKGQRIFPIIFNLVWDSWLDMAGFLFRNEIAMKNWSFSGLSSLSDT